MTSFHIIPTTSISSLLFLFLYLSPIISAQFFKDLSGNPVINGGSYVISRNDAAPDEGPIVWGNSSNSKPCPLYVLQSYYPITSTSSSSNQQVPADNSITIRSPLKSLYIPLNAPVEITFNDKNTPCKKPLKWSVKPAKPFKAYYLVAGYDDSRYKGYFKVIDAGSGNINVYRLVYCLNSKTCLEVGNANKFPRRGVFGITSDPESINFYALDFHVSKASSTATSV